MCERIYHRYLSQSSELIRVDRERFKASGIELIEENLVYIDENEKVRHDYIRLAEIITQRAAADFYFAANGGI